MPNVSFCEDDRDMHYNPYVEPPFFCKLTLNDGSVINIEDTVGNGLLTNEMTSAYSASCVSVEIGDLCTRIYENTFNGWSITSLTIGNNVTSIGEIAFNTCNGLTSLIIPNSVQNIQYQCFYNCDGLKTLTIGNGITMIRDSSFCACSGLTRITIEAETPPRLLFESDEIPFSRTNSCPIYVPSGSVDAYKTAEYWSTYADRIQAISTE